MARWRLDTAHEGNVPDATGHGHDGRTDPGPAPSRRQAAIVARLSPPLAGFEWRGTDDGHLRLKIPAGAAPLRYTLRLTGVATESDIKTLAAAAAAARQSRRSTSSR